MTQISKREQEPDPCLKVTKFCYRDKRATKLDLYLQDAD